MQIQVDRFTQRAMDDQFLDMTRKESTESSLTGVDIHVVAVPKGNPNPNVPRDSKVGFDLTGAKVARPVPRLDGSSSPTVANEFYPSRLSPSQRPPQQPQQEPHSSYVPTVPKLSSQQQPPHLQERSYLDMYPGSQSSTH